jgi:hypothetical protein
MSRHGMGWRRAKAGKPTQFANTRFPRDDLGRRAKAAFEQWRQDTLTQSQRRSLCRPLGR